MPTYEYKCECTEDIFEYKRAFNEPETDYYCPFCDSVLTRLFRPVGVQFKGKGFYTTDYGKK